MPKTKDTQFFPLNKYLSSNCSVSGILHLLIYFYIYFYSHPNLYLLTVERRGRESAREQERIISVREKRQSVASHTRPDLGMCLDVERNPQPFGVWEDASRSWATWPGLCRYFKEVIKKHFSPGVIMEGGALHSTLDSLEEELVGRLEVEHSRLGC